MRVARDTALRAISIRGSTHHTFSSRNRGGVEPLNYIPRRHDSKRPAFRAVERNGIVVSRRPAGKCYAEYACMHKLPSSCNTRKPDYSLLTLSVRKSIDDV
ncbi:unnamed protein product [Cercospora beticola]|nr:unnamed protein product [Cercospora beticola]